MILMNVGKLRLKSKKKKLQFQSLTTVIPVLRTQKRDVSLVLATPGPLGEIELTIFKNMKWVTFNEN